MLLDIKMPGMDGVEVLEKARAIRPAPSDADDDRLCHRGNRRRRHENRGHGLPDQALRARRPDLQGGHRVCGFRGTGYRKETVGAIVLATGTACYEPSEGKNPMGYGVVPNVVTSLEFERMLSGTGPDGGRLLRPSDKRPVKKAAWIQCVGSRDLGSGADFCSTICCMFALKEAAGRQDGGR